MSNNKISPLFLGNPHSLFYFYPNYKTNTTTHALPIPFYWHPPLGGCCICFYASSFFHLLRAAADAGNRRIHAKHHPARLYAYGAGAARFYGGG